MKTEQLKTNLTPAFLMFRDNQVSLEGALQMAVKACKEAGLEFVVDAELPDNPMFNTSTNVEFGAFARKAGWKKTEEIEI